MSSTIHQSVKDLALQVPGATRVLERAGIDYCCGGWRSLEDACAIAGVDAHDLLATLRALEAAEGATAAEENIGAMALAGLIAHIERTHHVFTRDELARLDVLLAKVQSKHEQHHPELVDVRIAFDNLRADLVPHMQKEEMVLFPYIAAMERARTAGRPIPRPPFITVENPVRMMMLEHDAAGGFLRAIRAATANFALPEDACMSYQALYEGLQDLERDLHQHIHLENNVLFPRAVEMEAE